MCYWLCGTLALSEGELRLALIMPCQQGWVEDELAAWLTRKRDAQEQLVENLTMQAQFLFAPGRTLDQWIQFTAKRRFEHGRHVRVDAREPGGSSRTGCGSVLRQPKPAEAPAERPEIGS